MHEGHVDTLINNAGITGPRVPAGELAGADAELVFGTNAISVVRVTNAFLPLLRESERPAVINVSSGMGSFALTRDPERIESKIVAPLYKASKAAVTMLTIQYAQALPEIRFNAADPGYTAIDLNGHQGIQTPSPKAPTPSSPWQPRVPALEPAGSSTAVARSPGNRRPPPSSNGSSGMRMNMGRAFGRLSVGLADMCDDATRRRAGRNSNSRSDSA